jgi:hypothetical protein
MPNIRSRDLHSDCWRLDFTMNGNWWGQPGDVKRCPHGKLMIRRQVPPNARTQGPGTDWWDTLSPIFNPIDYSRAKKALA